MTKVVDTINKVNYLGLGTSGIDSINGGSLSGFKNRLQNPLFQVDIEGNAGGVAPASGAVAHVVEGWRITHTSDVTTLTGSRVAGDSVPYALRMTVTTGSDTSIAAAQLAAFQTALEGYDIADAKWGTADAKPVWISGRIKAPTTGTYCVGVRNAASNRSFVFEVACTAGTWVDFEKEVPGDTSGTWDSTTGMGFLLSFTAACGSSLQTTADTWAAGAYLSTANQANGLATNSNVFEIENIRVSVGKPIKTEWRPYPLDLAQCQRYYRKFTGRPLIWAGYISSGGGYGVTLNFMDMRTTPSIVTSGFTSLGIPEGPTVVSSPNSVEIEHIANTTLAYGFFLYSSITLNARMI